MRECDARMRVATNVSTASLWVLGKPFPASAAAQVLLTGIPGVTEARRRWGALGPHQRSLPCWGFGEPLPGGPVAPLS